VTDDPPAARLPEEDLDRDQVDPASSGLRGLCSYNKPGSPALAWTR